MSPTSPKPAPRQLFVTTALPYANGNFHIGHIMEYLSLIHISEPTRPY